MWWEARTRASAQRCTSPSDAPWPRLNHVLKQLCNPPSPRDPGVSTLIPTGPGVSTRHPHGTRGSVPPPPLTGQDMREAGLDLQAGTRGYRVGTQA